MKKELLFMFGLFSLGFGVFAGELESSGHVGDPDQPIPSEGVADAKEERGGLDLPYVLDKGTKVFRLEAVPVKWHILPHVVVTAWSYNGMVPGPKINVIEGDRVRIVVKNSLPIPTTIHWHGLDLPNEMDGVSGMTQKPIMPGESFTYEFMVKSAGTYWYHSHHESDVQISVGLSGAFIVKPRKPEAKKYVVDKVLLLAEWKILEGETYPAMPMAGMEANFFTINGKSFPATETIKIRKGDLIRLRFIGAGQLIHPMHIHGPAFRIVATDGHDVPEAAVLTKDTVLVGPGERYDIEWRPTETGMWMLHCHIPHHTTNDHQELGGLMLTLEVTD